MMFIPKKKVYGDYKKESCPFCNKIALIKNSQGVPVCTDHKSQELQEFKCACGESLTLLTGKFGPYFSCNRCGNINFKKALGVNQAKVAVNKPQNSYVETRDKMFE